MKTEPIKAPFPYFGGKSKVAPLVWSRLGDVDNYIEPFFGSGAVLLGRPTEAKVETVNDLNAYLANFWRAVQGDPEGVAYHADWPVNETDLHARHRWLVQSPEALEALEKVRSDSAFFDVKIAGWWVWGACCWIASGWCSESEQGDKWSNRPELAGWKGINGRPQLADAFSRGRGVNSNDNASTCQQRREFITDWMQRLADRLRPVRVCCGHWNRICGSLSTTTQLGLCGVFLDPPYRMTVDGKKNRDSKLYATDGDHVDSLCDEVQAWCVDRGSDKQFRIALCGYEGEYPGVEAAGWACVPWKTQGGYSNQSGKANENASRERIWFSPHCLSDAQKSLF